MKNTDFPTITTVVQAEPWEEGHIARISSPCLKKRFYKRLIYSVLPPSNSSRNLVSHCQSAAYNVLPPKARVLSGGIFCALLLGLMLSFASCSKGVKVPEPVEGPTLKNDTAPNQGVSFEIDTTWLEDTTPK